MNKGLRRVLRRLWSFYINLKSWFNLHFTESKPTFFPQLLLHHGRELMHEWYFANPHPPILPQPTRPAINWYRRPTSTRRIIRNIMERRGITLSGVERGSLDCCAKKAYHPLWTVLVDSSAPENHIQHRRSVACNRKTHDRPALFRRLSRPAPLSDTLHYFLPGSSKLCGSPCREPEPVHDSFRDNPHHKSLLIMEVPETV